MTAKVVKKSRKPNPSRGSKPGERRGGRQKGTSNAVTTEFRATVQRLLDDNRGNVGRWLTTVAEGDGTKSGKPDPARALDLLAKLAEFAAPKLNRTEVSGPDGGAIQYTKVERVIVRPKNPDG